jgi:glycosyltransferase involved in cell wall biosynthesis
MRVLLIHRYFWPDAPPYATMLRTIGGRLAAEGHEVSVLSTQPSYNTSTRVQRRPSREQIDGMRVTRVPLLSENRHQTLRRLVNTLLYLFQVFWYIARRRDQIVMCSTMPPVASGLVVRCALSLTRRSGRYIYHCQDIYPEAAVVGGLLRAGWRYRLLRRIDTATCRKAAAVVVLSDDMRDTLRQRGIEPAGVEVLNNFSLADPSGAVTRRADVLPPREPSDFVVAFAGNLGRFQQLDMLIDAAWHMRSEPAIQWWIVGDGVVRDDLRRRAGSLIGHTVHFIGYQPPDVAFGVLVQADLAVVSLRPGMHRVGFPSKTVTALMAGCRLMIVAQPDSDLARLSRNAGLGSDVAPGDVVALAGAVREERRARGAAARMRARAYAREHFAADVVGDAWVRLFKRMSDEVPA